MEIKKSILTLAAMAIMGVGPKVFAQGYEPMILDNTDVVNLNINRSSLEIHLLSPGMILCGLEIRLDRGTELGLSQFLKAIEITDQFIDKPEIVLLKNNKTAIVDISVVPRRFGAILTIQTKEGCTLREAILRTLGVEAKIVMLGRACL